jgi:hypothetical protein
MNVVGHDNERTQLIPATRSIKQVSHDALGDIGSSQPLWPVYCPVEPQIPLRESMTIVSALPE